MRTISKTSELQNASHHHDELQCQTIRKQNENMKLSIKFRLITRTKSNHTNPNFQFYQKN